SYMNQMRLVHFNSIGENGDCKLPTIGLATDTLGYSEQPFTWQNITSENLDNTISVPAQAVNTPTFNNVCFNNLCTDQTPLPPGCNKTSRIEYGGQESQFYRDFVTTLDGGRIAVGEISSDALAVKLDVNGQPLWSKRFENFFHTMKFVRVLRTVDNNYWLFANDNQTLNNKAASYIDIVKIDESGNILWSRQLDMGYYGLVSAVIADVAQAPDNGFVLMVNDGYGTGSMNSYAMRYDANANIVWQKEIIHPGAVPVYKSVTCSQDAVFLGYDSYDYSSFDKFGMEKLDLKTGNLLWSNRYSINAGNLEMMNRIFSINDTTYTFVNNFIPVGPFSSVMNSVMVKLGPDGKLIQSLFLNGENMVPAASIYSQDASPPTVVLTSEHDFVMCNHVDVGGIKKLNIARFDKTGKALWSRNFEGMNNHTPMNFHQQGKGFLATGFVDIVHPGNASWKNAFLLKVDSSGKILNNATGDCQQMDRGFYPGPGPVTLDPLPPRQTNDLSGPSFKSINVSSQDVEQDPKAFCIQKANCGTVALKQKGTACSMKDALKYYLQDPSTCDAAASWQYDTAYFRKLYADGDSILLIPLREGASSVTATFEGNCFLTIKKMNTSILHPASSVNLGPDTILCVGGSLRLSTGSIYASYRWSDNSTDSILTVNTSGKYYVEVTDQCGHRATDTILVRPASLGFQIIGDTSTCNHTAANLVVSSGYNNYQWTPTDHLISSGNRVQVNPDVNTEYKVTAEKFPGCIVADSFMVKALASPPIQLRTDTTLCSGDSLLLQAPMGFLHYTWNTGDSSSFIYAKAKGVYTVKAVYTNGCQSTGASQVLNVYANPFPNLDKNPVLCEGSVRELSANQTYQNYLWNTGSTARAIQVDVLGTYWLQVQDQNGCFGEDTVNIQSIAQTPSAFLSSDTVLCEFQKLTLTSKKLYQDYTWSDQSSGPTLQISRPGIYWLTVKDENGCVGSDTVVVTQKQCSIGLFVPNAFTPDHRGNNEVFRPILLGNVVNMDFQVFNRWGQRVFQTNQQGQGWDGTIGNMPCAAQAYIWICSYTLKGALPVHEKGTVILIR
ncbi:MAG: gliding motility-associated C-terminal domain-containing protein, partial [Bacteroidota bacterium]|nr:gliding motility-associated C-terminal domain-containing protein [Bacteroidota bacterium]